MANRILSMAFEVSDNVVFRGAWWESMAEADRQRLVGRTFSGVENVDRAPDCLKDDGLQALTTTVEKEYVHYGGAEDELNL